MNLHFKTLGLEFSADVKATPFVPASVCGLPENSSPEEVGEIESWENLEVLVKDDTGAKQWIDAMFLLDSEVADKIEEAAYQAIAEYTPECDYD